MMTLDNTGIKDRLAWEEQGYQLPCFDREKVTAATMENPFWVHFGAGNLFRAFTNIYYDVGDLRDDEFPLS